VGAVFTETENGRYTRLAVNCEYVLLLLNRDETRDRILPMSSARLLVPGPFQSRAPDRKTCRSHPSAHGAGKHGARLSGRSENPPQNGPSA
jgi:hypothetical protein